jgi:hypothetical protein
VLCAVCAASLVADSRRRAVEHAAMLRRALAPLLSLVGVGGVGVFLWAWTGTPFATIDAQRAHWGERADPFSLVHLAGAVRDEITRGQGFDLNPVVALCGVAVLFLGLGLLATDRGRLSVEATTWALGIGFLGCVSEHVPPTPRLLITAFPVVIVYARFAGRQGWALLIAVNGVLLSALSWLTFVGSTLTP